MSETPNWLTATAAEAQPQSQPQMPQPAFTLAAPPEALASQLEPEPEPEQEIDAAAVQIGEVADLLISFKRFWQDAPNTSNERDDAIRCALYIVGILHADQSQ